MPMAGMRSRSCKLIAKYTKSSAVAKLKHSSQVSLITSWCGPLQLPMCRKNSNLSSQQSVHPLNGHEYKGSSTAIVTSSAGAERFAMFSGSVGLGRKCSARRRAQRSQMSCSVGSVGLVAGDTFRKSGSLSQSELAAVEPMLDPASSDTEAAPSLAPRPCSATAPSRVSPPAAPRTHSRASWSSPLYSDIDAETPS